MTAPDRIHCRSFGEAAGLALELHDLFGRHHAVLLLDDGGHSVDLHVFTDREHRLSHAVSVGTALAGWLPDVTSAVLFSEVDAIDALSEDDARLWRVLVRSFAEQGVELVDWLHTDADRVRSLTISCDAEPTWEHRSSGFHGDPGAR